LSTAPAALILVYVDRPITTGTDSEFTPLCMINLAGFGERLT